MTKYQHVLNNLKDLGLVSARAEFSGGNDSGGVDFAMGYKADGTEREFSWDEINDLGLSEPVYDRYSSFAGDFYVDGRVMFDVESGRVTMDLNEGSYSYEHQRYEV